MRDQPFLKFQLWKVFFHIANSLLFFLFLLEYLIFKFYWGIVDADSGVS